MGDSIGFKAHRDLDDSEIQMCKIGTCEFMYYSTYEDLVKAKMQGNCGDDSIPYLSIEKALFFRFPFASEDSTEIFDYETYNESQLLGHFDHDTLDISRDHHSTITLEAKTPVGRVYQTVDCPCKEESTAKGPLGDKIALHIIAQKMVLVDGRPHLYPVFKCGMCGGMFSIGLEDTDFIEAIQKKTKGIYERAKKESDIISIEASLEVIEALTRITMGMNGKDSKGQEFLKLADIISEVE